MNDGSWKHAAFNCKTLDWDTPIGVVMLSINIISTVETKPICVHVGSQVCALCTAQEKHKTCDKGSKNTIKVKLKQKFNSKNNEAKKQTRENTKKTLSSSCQNKTQ